MSRGLRLTVLTAFFASTLAAPAKGWAGVTVENFHTIAETNGYAPFSQAQYFAQQDLKNISPANADVSGDWTGTNAGGSTSTWHWVGSSHTSMNTNFSDNSVNVTGSGSFGFSLTTNQNFIQPSAVDGVYQPSGAADYTFQFDIDTPATYAVSALMTGFSVLELGSFDGTFPFLQSNRSPATVLFTQTGTISPGRYFLEANAGLGVDLPNGANDFSASGSFSNYNFTLQTPEPDLGFGAVLAGACVVVLKRRRLRLREQMGDWG